MMNRAILSDILIKIIQMKKVLGMGNALVDVMTQLNDDALLNTFGLPKGSMQLVDAEFSQKIQEGTAHLNPALTSGGSAANTIHGLAHLGVPTAFIGKVGDDETGKVFKQDMIQSGIDPMLMIGTQPSGCSVALVSPDSERTFATYLGSAVELSEADLKPDHFAGYDYFHIEGYLVQNHDLIRRAVQLAKENGLKVSLDMASYNVVEDNIDFLLELLTEYVDIVFANEEEAKAFTGKEPREALDVFANLCEVAVVKIGKAGSYVKSGEVFHKVDVIDATPIDTTGAGDLYAAGFLFGVAKQLPMDDCGKLGTILSNRVIEVIGAKIDAPRWDWIKDQVNVICAK